MPVSVGVGVHEANHGYRQTCLEKCRDIECTRRMPGSKLGGGAHVEVGCACFDQFVCTLRVGLVHHGHQATVV